MECRVRDTFSEPLPTQPGDPSHALLTPYFVETGYTHAPGNRSTDSMDSLPTRTTRPTTALVVPGFLSKQYGGNAAPEHMGIGLSEATGTVTTWDHHAFVGMPFLMYAGSNPYEPRGVDEVAPTMTCSERSALVTPSAFLSYYYGNLQASGLHEAAGTVTTVDRAASS